MPIRVGLRLQVSGRADHVIEIDSGVERVGVQHLGPVESPLPAVQCLDVGRERDALQVTAGL